MFNRTIFQRMKTDNREPSADLQKFGYKVQCPLQVSQFVVDGDPQGLKNARGRVDRPPLSGNALADQLRELPGGFDRRQLAGLDDPPSHPSAVSFLPISIKDIGEFLLLERVHEIGGAGNVGIRVEPHVERSVVAEAEASIVPGELVGGEPQIQENPVDSSQPQRLQRIFDFAIRRLHKADMGLITRVDRRQGQHIWIAIEPDHSSGLPNPFRQGTRVPPCSGRPIHEDRPLSGVEPVNDLIKQDRLMDGLRRWLRPRRFGSIGNRFNFGRHDELARCLGQAQEVCPRL